MPAKLATRLRKDATEAEKRLWSALRDRRLAGLKFPRQHPIGTYVVDFVCLEKNLIIEVDGGQHGSQVDAKRTSFLQAEGFCVLRFWNPEVLTRLNDVLATIIAAAERSSPKESPSPLRVEGLG